MDNFVKKLGNYWDEQYGKVGKNKITGNFSKKRVEIGLCFNYIKDRDSIVDLGCGLAHVPGVLSLCYPHLKYVGVDASKVAVEKVESIWKLPAKQA